MKLCQLPADFDTRVWQRAAQMHDQYLLCPTTEKTAFDATINELPGEVREAFESLRQARQQADSESFLLIAPACDAAQSLTGKRVGPYELIELIAEGGSAVQRCPSCSANVPGSARYCSACGGAYHSGSQIRRSRRPAKRCAG